MGFDINVYMTLQLCPETGKPYYYGKDLKHVYEPLDIVVPEELRQYLKGRGRIFHAYTEVFNNKDKYDVDVEEFLESYPRWDVVKENEYYKDEMDYWTLKDHKGFKNLLKWCRDQQIFFRVSWSY